MWICASFFLLSAISLADSDSLEERLASCAYWERMGAFKEVANVSPEEQLKYLPLLVQGLRDTDMEFRLAAVRALSRFGDNAKPAIPVMVKTLEIRQGEARIQITQDIAKLGSLAVPALIDALKESNPYVVWGACETLAKIGAPAHRAIPTLERLTDDIRPEVRSGSRAALAALNDE